MKKKNLILLVSFLVVVGVVIAVIIVMKSKSSDSSSPDSPSSSDSSDGWKPFLNEVMIKPLSSTDTLNIGSFTLQPNTFIPDFEKGKVYSSLPAAKNDCMNNTNCKGVQQMGVGYFLTNGNKHDSVDNVPSVKTLKDGNNSLIKPFNLYLLDGRN